MRGEYRFKKMLFFIVLVFFIIQIVTIIGIGEETSLDSNKISVYIEEISTPVIENIFSTLSIFEIIDNPEENPESDKVLEIKKISTTADQDNENSITATDDNNDIGSTDLVNSNNIITSTSAPSTDSSNSDDSSAPTNSVIDKSPIKEQVVSTPDEKENNFALTFNNAKQTLIVETPNAFPGETLKIKVKNSKDEPVSTAKIEIFNKVTTTNEKGEANVKVFSTMGEGKYFFTIKKDGYNTHFGLITILEKPPEIKPPYINSASDLPIFWKNHPKLNLHILIQHLIYQYFQIFKNSCQF